MSRPNSFLKNHVEENSIFCGEKKKMYTQKSNVHINTVLRFFFKWTGHLLFSTIMKNDPITILKLSSF